MIDRDPRNRRRRLLARSAQENKNAPGDPNHDIAAKTGIQAEAGSETPATVCATPAHRLPLGAVRVLAITLSDRARRGDYEDRSGPLLVERLNAFFRERGDDARVEYMLLADDPADLEAALLGARDNGYDAVFTTGGTGIALRDITPDVVMRLADKLIPGIMEYIRLKHAERLPSSLISRSVAAVLHSTLVYTLPGSPKAVDEYLDEIFKSLPHAVMHLRGADPHK